MLANCEHCGKEFEKKKGMHALCSLRCRLYSKTKRDKDTGCLLFTGCLNQDGYGQVAVTSGMAVGAHRVAWMVNKGTITEGAQVLHRCDVRNCVEISHLFLGTQLDNIADMKDKSRHVWHTGSGHGMAILDEDKVLEIKRKLELNEIPTEIARQYGVTSGVIYRIRNGQSWKHVHLNPVKPDPEHPCSIGPFQWEEEKFPLL